jgi:hypothetical protein|tara:strand:- start:90 stop:326 length:237 start_codon:yes stop_codon:yes gene_type:complete
MALTEEQQSQIDINAAMEANRATTQAAQEAARAKLESVRMAKEILVENRRTTPAAEASDITSAQVTAMANDLASYVNS